jgi:hypothetical protein
MLTDSYEARCEICICLERAGLLRNYSQEEHMLCLKHDKQRETLIMKLARSPDVVPQWHKSIFAVTGMHGQTTVWVDD